MEAAAGWAGPLTESDVLAAQRGDRDAFTRLIDATRNVVCAITFAILRDVTSSEDVAQDVFVAAWSSVGKLRNPSSFLPWLRQLARNHAHEFLRSKVRHRRRHAPWVEGDALSIADAAADAGDRLIDREERLALAAAIEELPDDAREIVTLYYREGRSIRQVAELLGLSEDAIKKRLERTRAVLKTATLDRFAEAARKTAPGAGFTAAVTAAIVLASPATASAAGVGIAKVASGAGSAGTLAKLAAVLGGPALGLTSAVTAILFGGRRLAQRARDDQERKDVRRFTAANLLLVLATFAAWGIGPRLWSGPLPIVIPELVFAAGMFAAYIFWLPRIIARRQATERAENPQAWRRQRRERLLSITGTVLGLCAGLAGLLYGLMHR